MLQQHSISAIQILTLLLLQCTAALSCLLCLTLVPPPMQAWEGPDDPIMQALRQLQLVAAAVPAEEVSPSPPGQLLVQFAYHMSGSIQLQRLPQGGGAAASAEEVNSQPITAHLWPSMAALWVLQCSKVMRYLAIVRLTDQP